MAVWANQATAPDRWSPSMFWLLGLCAFTSMAAMRLCDAMLPALAEDFEVTTGQASHAISGFALAYGVLQLFYGLMGQRYGPARVMGYACCASTIGSVAAALAPSLPWLVAGRILTGATAAGIVPMAMAWVGSHIPYSARSMALAKLSGAVVCGMMFGQLFGALAAALFDWRLAFAAVGLAFLLNGMALCQRIRVSSSPSPSVASIGTCCAQRPIRHVLSRPWARVVLIVTGLEGALALGAVSFIPTHMQANFHMTPLAAGAIVVFYGLGGLFYSCCACRLLQRRGEAAQACLAGACLGLAWAAMAWATHWAWFMPACWLAGLGFYALHNTLQTQATQMAPAMRSMAVSLFVCTLFVGQAAGVMAAAWVVDHLGPSMVFCISSAGLVVLTGMFAWRLHRRSRPLADA
ncbi:arabinose ABC transporter permease [Vandammella animalimorsus]|uniref:Arabinose ABC transporter permease n=1 Tax=Vandammella animalimorsus TaxID=2029117 RepID=A0A2A2AQ41_9BURK|nr:MFS transporter [Vandammella animalimorsus]PAT39956.1 arabinose ABC transporter permease [Vandammella animalimorsus]